MVVWPKVARAFAFCLEAALLLLLLSVHKTYDLYEHGGGAVALQPVCGPASQPPLLIYNRIPKCGSTFMTRLMTAVSRQQRGVHVISSPPRGYFPKQPFAAGTEWEGSWRRLAELAQAPGAQTIYINHMYFADFSAHGLPEPLWLQLMRQPVDRFVSSYYYTLFGPRPKALKEKERTRVQAWLGPKSNTSINTYVERHVKQHEVGCVEGSVGPMAKANLQMKFFCGFHRDCERICGAAALARAKRVLAERYALVGTLERLEETTWLMERMLPDWFAGLRRAEQQNEQKLLQGSGGFKVNKHKGEAATARTRRLLEVINSQDMALYDFAAGLLAKKIAGCLPS